MKVLTTRSLTHTAAAIATLAFAATMLMQLLLAAGILPITMAWGGSQPVLTMPLRIASLAAIVLLGLFAYLIRWRAGLAGSQPTPTWVKLVAWVITMFLALNTLGNALSPSLAEKLISGSISLIGAVACLLVAVSKTADPIDRVAHPA
jgi:hypothetical protein